MVYVRQSQLRGGWGRKLMTVLCLRTPRIEGSHPGQDPYELARSLHNIFRRLSGQSTLDIAESSHDGTIRVRYRCVCRMYFIPI